TTNDTSENVVAEVTSGYQEFGLSSKAAGTESGLSRISPEVVFETGNTTYTAIAWLNSSYFVVAFRDVDDTNKGKAVIGVIAADGTISFGVASEFEAGSTIDISVVGLDATRFAIAYVDAGDSNNGKAIIGETDGSTAVDNFGAINVFNAAGTSGTSVARLDATHFVIAYSDTGNSSHGTAIVGLTDGDVTISSYGVENVFNAATTSYVSVGVLDSSHFVVAYNDGGNSNHGTGIVGLTDGAVTISSYGSENLFNSAITSVISLATLDPTRFVVAYKDEGASDQGTAIIGLTDGATAISSYGSESIFNAVATKYISVARTENNKFIVVYQDDGGSDYGAFRIGSTSGTVISGYDTEYEFNAAITSEIVVTALDGIHYIVGFKDEGNSNQGTVMTLAPKFYINVDLDGAGASEDGIQLTAG
ncbi:hypothetical protein LCGC14_2764650, partial [marine sediment metagenome]